MAEQHEKALVPQIRFTGFTDPWEQRKLGELFEESDERASDREILSVSVANGIYPASESDRETNPGASLANYKVVHSGDVVYNSMRMWQGAVDASRYDGIVSPAYVVAKPNSEVYARFFARLLRQPMLLKQYQQVSQGNSKDTQVLKFDDFASIEISMPASENEQRRIGAFFDRLDSLITLHQRKYDKLCVLKKSMLDKMFPKGGSLYPEIRFAGFTDPWEQRKLGELTESYSGGTPAAGESEFYGGSIPFIRSAEIAAESTELFLTEKGYESSSARMVKPGDVLYALYGATSGEVAVSRQKGAINQAILAILPRDDCDARYITAWLRKQKGYIVTTYLQGGQGNLSGVIVKNLEVFIPSLPEQQKIGFMLSHLDSLITLHQRKLELLRNIKKSMLDKMFV